MSDVAADAGSKMPGVEVLRASILGQELHCEFRMDAVPDPETWGLVLADVARYVADAIQEQGGPAPPETLRAIRAAFEQGLADEESPAPQPPPRSDPSPQPPPRSGEGGPEGR